MCGEAGGVYGGSTGGFEGVTYWPIRLPHTSLRKAPYSKSWFTLNKVRYSTKMNRYSKPRI